VRQFKVVEYLIKAGAKLDTPVSDWMPIHYAVASQDVMITSFLLNISKEQLNFMTKQKTSPLHFAVTSGCYQMVLLLLKSGANLNQANTNGRTALHMAMINLDINIARALLSFGAKIDAQDSQGKKPYDYAVSRNNTALIGYLESINSKKSTLPTQQDVIHDFQDPVDISNHENPVINQKDLDSVVDDLSTRVGVIEESLMKKQ